MASASRATGSFRCCRWSPPSSPRSLGTPDRFAEITSAPYLDPTVPTLRPHPVGLFFPDVRPFRPELEVARPGARLPLRAQRFNEDRTVLITLGAGPELLSTVLGALREVPVNVLIETGAYEVGALGSLPKNVAAARECRWRLPCRSARP